MIHFYFHWKPVKLACKSADEFSFLLCGDEKRIKVWLCLMTLLSVIITQWIYKSRNDNTWSWFCKKLWFKRLWTQKLHWLRVGLLLTAIYSKYFYLSDNSPPLSALKRTRRKTSVGTLKIFILLRIKSFQAASLKHLYYLVFAVLSRVTTLVATCMCLDIQF